MQIHYLVGDQVKSVRVQKAQNAGRFTVTVGDVAYEVEVVHHESGRILVCVDGRRVRAVTAADGDRRWVQLAGSAPVELDVGESVSGASRHRHGGDGRLAATMHSQVVSVAVGPGTSVKRGDTLVVLEAMKMETRLLAPCDGTVTAVHCSAGQVVEPGVSLVELEEA